MERKLGFSSFSSVSSFSASSSPEETLSLAQIIPGLPNDLAILCLAFLPFTHHARLKSTCKSWRSVLSSTFLFDLRRLWRKSEEFLCLFPSDPSLSFGALFDPRHLLWSRIPPMPCHAHRFGLSNFACVAAGGSVFVLGGSLFDARSYPLGVPLPSSAVFRLSLLNLGWQKRSPMLHERAGFACAARSGLDGTAIVVAGGGSRHAEFGVGGSRIGAVEWYDVEKDEWFIVEEELPNVRAGCVGFYVGEDEFWVMGGYGDCQTVSGVFPVDDYYRDGAVLSLQSRKWRQIEPMWAEGERWRLGNVVAVEDETGELPEIFMLEGTTIFRYSMLSNRWQVEAYLPRKIGAADPSFGFIALDGELHVMSEPSRGLHVKLTPQKKVPLIIQIYHPLRKTWRFLQVKPPFRNIDFRCAVMCSVRL